MCVERENVCVWECKRRRTMGSRFGSQTESENWKLGLPFYGLQSLLSSWLSACGKSNLKQTLSFFFTLSVYLSLSWIFEMSGACFDHAYLWRKITLNFKQRAYNVSCLWCHSLEVGYLSLRDMENLYNEQTFAGPLLALLLYLLCFLYAC